MCLPTRIFIVGARVKSSTRPARKLVGRYTPSQRPALKESGPSRTDILSTMCQGLYFRRTWSKRLKGEQYTGEKNYRDVTAVGAGSEVGEVEG